MAMGGGLGSNSTEMASLTEKLRISESLMAEMTKSWEEKLRETEKLHRVREREREGERVHTCTCEEKRNGWETIVD